MIRVAVIDDHPLILEMVNTHINRAGDMEIVGTTRHGSELFKLVHDTSPDVVILDLSISREVFEPVSAVQQLLKEFPNVKVLILTASESLAYIRDLLKAGALGYVLKFDDLSMELPKAVRMIYRGEKFISPEVVNILLTEGEHAEVQLTDRELQILRLVADCHNNKRISELLGVSEKWIRDSLSDVYGKLGLRGDVNSRMAAVSKARELGLLPIK
jgi:DNA-binding NarL/FixJ family response regulator